MPVSCERKTLTIGKKSSLTMWPNPSEIELIERGLKEATKGIIEQYSNSKTNPQDEKFRIKVAIMNVISKAEQELKSAHDFPTQVKRVFENICKNVHLSLATEVGAKADIFEEAMNAKLQTKHALPKVVDLPRGRF